MNLPELELKILQWWKENGIFEKSVEKSSPKGDFVFYEGPPTANGKPGIHHVISRAFKDIIPRFKTMRGYRVVRKGGWDTHGLPVELEVEKQLGLKNKKEVEGYGIGPFNQKCRESVWQYRQEWERFTDRMGFWVDLPNAYITYEGSYVNALWGVIKKIWERGLLVEGHKVVPHCPRCGTALSSHELAQGYSTVKDTSLTVKFQITSFDKLRMTNDKVSKVYILSWTTTPWTLPGNVGLAVGKEIDYAIVRITNSESGIMEYVTVAKERLSVVEGEYEVIQELKGSELVGLEYEPLFDIPALKSPASYKMYPADFVSTTDGTGVVHTAVMYGEDDYRLGTEVGLPKHHTVDPDGKFNTSTPEFLRGKFVKDKETEKSIIEDLGKRGLLFKKELYEHDYPFCWRCKTPLLYYAKHSWFVAMSKLRQELLDANNQIHWVPEYIKEGRFGEWLREVKDWAFSRERYWGTPLPVWRCSQHVIASKAKQSPGDRHASLGSARDDNSGCGRLEVIGSVAELVEKSKLKNRYIFLRHAESEGNIRDVCNGSVEESVHYPLTERGRGQVKDVINKFKEQRIHIDAIYSSDFLRTKETARAIAETAHVEVVFDKRLRDIVVAGFEGKPVKEYKALFQNVIERFIKKPQDGETLGDVLIRMCGLVLELEKSMNGKTILFVSHADPLWVLMWAMNGSKEWLEKFPYPPNASPNIVDHGVFLTDERGELDLHRPRVDEVEWPCACGGVMRRVSEVADVWFDSGAMPFAQYGENVEALGSDRSRPVGTLRQFPADYISEAIDQTRGWFYTLLAVSVALGKGTPYKNVICLGHVLDAKGKKMSKSLGNIVVPGEMFDKYGADSVRWYLYAMNDPGLPKRFDERELNEVVKKFFMILWNVVSFHELYPPQKNSSFQLPASSFHVLDRWILARLNQLTRFVTERLEAYDITPAGRAIQEFVTELSTWYVRRSRERIKMGDEEARQTLKYVLIELSKLLAPFVPFTAESLWQKLKVSGLELTASKDSVHLSDWPEFRNIDEEVLANMESVRKIVEAGLAARAAAKMPIRQPLQSARIWNLESGIKAEYIEILKDELNVKEIVVEKGKGELRVELDTNLSEELKLEGMKRELIRAVNNLRKEAKLTIKDKIKLEIQSSNVVDKLIKNYKDELLAATISETIVEVNELDVTQKGSVSLDGKEVKFWFRKV